MRPAAGEMPTASPPRTRRRYLRPRPAPLLLLVAAAAMLASGPLLGQAFQLLWGGSSRRAPQQQQRPPQPQSQSQSQPLSPMGPGTRGVSPVVMFAKPKKGPKGLDAAKAAALAALEELDKLEAAAAPPMPAPAAGDKPSPLDKKAAKKAKKEKEKAEAAALKEAMAKPKDMSSVPEPDAKEAPEPEPEPEPIVAKAPAPAAPAASSPKAAREAAMAALAAMDDEDEEKKEGEDEFDFEAMLSQGGGSKKGKKDKKGKKGKKGGGVDDDFAFEATPVLEKPAPVAPVMKEEPVAAPEPVMAKASSGSVGNAAAAEAQAAALEEAEAAAAAQGPTLEERVRSSKPPGRVRIASDGAAPGTVFVRLDSVGVIFRNQEVIKDASWGVQTGERVGLVGPNGGGKTTQLKVLAGELEPTTGEVIKSSKNVRVAFLRQEFVDELDPKRSLKDEFLSVFKEEQGVLARLSELEKALEGATDDPDAMDKILQDLGEAQAEAERRGVYGLETRVDKIMDMMGFAPNDGNLPVRAFSGGWKMRIGLGKVLLQDPGVLMLDEPTNHLDLDSVEWLESFLRTQTLPMIIVSHDREFLDRVCTKIVDVDGGECVSYTGNYSNFLKQKKARLEAWQKAYDNQQKKIQEEKDFINRFRSNAARAPQVKSRELALEKLLKSDELVKRPPFQGTAFKFRFPPGPRLQGEVVAIEGLQHGYNNDVLFEDANLTIEKGHRVAIIGPNGVGKSTLLRLVMGIEKPSLGGRAAITAGNAVANYFEQNQADALDLDLTVDETITRASTTESYNQLRALMAQFMFKGDAIYKKVGQLSGGEKARVALCKMMLKPGNLLCLDEPTNHLDIPAKEILEEACRNYDGAILLVSHDRYFVSQVANRIVAVEDKKLVVYEGDYKYYMEKNDEVKEKIEGRYVDGVSGIRAAPKDDQDGSGPGKKDKKNFGGKGQGPSGRKEKGIKNAKRMSL